MTPEEVFAQLRDIHSPAIEAATNATLDPRPLIAFAALVAAVLIVRYMLSAQQRRNALSRIDPDADPAIQRDALTKLAATTGQTRKGDPLPGALFDPPEALTRKSIAGLRDWVRRRLT